MAQQTDCRSEDGITVGIIDSIITMSRVLNKRLKKYHQEYEKRYQKDIEPNFIFPDPVYEALKDLHADNDLYIILQTGPYNNRILNEGSIELQETLLKAQNFLLENVKSPNDTLVLYDAKWVRDQMELLNEDMSNSVESIENVKYRIGTMIKKYNALLTNLNQTKDLKL